MTRSVGSAICRVGPWIPAAAFSLIGCSGTPLEPPPVPGTNLTTTSIVPMATGHYVGTITQPDLSTIPTDLTLFFRLLVGQASANGGPVLGTLAVRYEVTGGYNTGANSFSGTITGTLDGTPEDGLFTGIMTANLANGCVAQRNYSGPITRAGLNWNPAEIINDCGGASPLTFSVKTPAAMTPPTTSVPVTTTTSTQPTSTTTTVTPTCTYKVNPNTQNVPSQGGSFSAALTTSCLFTSTSDVSWITISAGKSGKASETISYSVAANPGAARTGHITVDGPGTRDQLTVRQSAFTSRCDLNHDFVINQADAQLVLNAILANAPYDSRYDINRNGQVDVGDFQAIVNETLNPGTKFCAG